MERHASHTVTLRGGSSKACSHGERRGDALRGVERIAVEKTGMASYTALFRERGSEAVMGSVWNNSDRTAGERLNTSRITVRESRAGHATNWMGPAAFAWARNRGGKHGFFTLRILRCAAEAARSGMDCLGETCTGKLRNCMEWIGQETSLSFGREAFAVRNGAARQVVHRHGSHRQHHAPKQRAAL